MRYVNILIITAALILTGVARGWSLEHDHQPWNEVRVGRMMAIHRMDPLACKRAGIPVASCTRHAADDAMRKLGQAVERLECRIVDEGRRPHVIKHEPLTQFDSGALVVAQMEDVYCEAPLRQELYPVSRSQFGGLCSRIDWKCDVVWISDGDPSVLYMNRLSDIPALSKLR